ncbi:MAG: hypothetical protein A3J97_05905 [Spirochaetes bacterium RIFOXYC1_FULL_54_7]|nr:MAG: hypothetical protein A3J97_05905 [Spirochaetes bacterium RIFOXYC1_FULL_54_7]
MVGTGDSWTVLETTTGGTLAAGWLSPGTGTSRVARQSRNVAVFIGDVLHNPIGMGHLLFREIGKSAYGVMYGHTLLSQIGGGHR